MTGDVKVGDDNNPNSKLTVTGATLDVTSSAGGMNVTGDALINALNGNISTATIKVKEDATVGGRLDVLDGSKLDLTSSDGGMAVAGDALIDNASTATIALNKSATVGGRLDVLDGSKLDLTSSDGGMAVTGDTLIDNASTATITLNKSAVVGGRLDVLNDSTLNLTSSDGGMAVTGDTLIDNASTATITLNKSATVGGTLDVLNGSELYLTSSDGGMAVAGETNIKNNSTATVTVYGDATVGDSAHASDLNVDRASTLNLTSTDGGMAVAGDALIDNASTATVRLHDTAEVKRTLDVLRGSKLDLTSSDGSMDIGDRTRIEDLSEVTATVKTDAIIRNDVNVDTSKLTVTAGNDAEIDGMVTAHGSRKADGTVDKDAIVNVDAGAGLRLVDRSATEHGGVDAKDANVKLVARTENMVVDHITAADAIVKARANTGSFRGKIVDMNTAAVGIEGYAGVTIASDENDEITDVAAYDEMNCYPVVTVVNSSSDDSISTTDLFTGEKATEALGLTIYSDAGALDSTDGGYTVLYNAATGDTVYEKNGKYFRFTFGQVKGDDRFEQIEEPANIGEYEDKGIWNLFAYNYADSPRYYDEGQRVYLERENVFYFMEGNGEIQIYGSLADKVKDDRGNASNVGNTKLYELRDVGVKNYYDGWLLDRSNMDVDVYGDVDLQDTMRMFESIANITSRNGALTVADYFIDTDGDGIGDEMELSEWDLRNSVANTEIDRNIRIDHLALQVSVMEMSVERDAINSKTWYMVGSKLDATAETAVQVINSDDKYFTPAVITFWSNDDLYLIRSDSGDEPVYEQLGLYVKARNGDVIFMTRQGEGNDANTTDFYSTASTVDVDARDRIIVLEALVNVDSATNNGGITTFTAPKGYDLQGNDPDTVTSADIYKLVDGVYTSMVDTNFSQSERAYGSEVNFKSSGEVDMAHAQGEQTPNSHISAANWTIEGASLKDGSLNAGIGQSDVNMTALGDVSFLYNLNHLPEGDRIAERELTITEGSHVTLTSTEGAVDLLNDYDSAADADSTLAYEKGAYVGDNGKDLATVKDDVRIAGDEASGQRSTLEILSGDALKVASVSAEYADVNLRSTNDDLLFDRIDASKTRLREMAAGNIDALHPQHSALIHFDDKDNRDDANRDAPDNASLTMNVEGDIGTADRPLHVDIPEALTMTVEKVTNLFVDARKRDEQGNLIDTTPDYAVDGGTAADGSGKTGDYLNYSNEQFFNLGIEALDSEKLAAWLLERGKTVFKDGATPGWTNMVAPGVDLMAYIQAMAGEAAPTGATLDELIALVGEEAILNQLLTDNAIVYNYVGADGYAAQGSLQDLINYLINNDGQYASALEEQLLKAAIAASSEYAKDMAKQLADARTAKANADAAVQENLDAKAQAEDSLWSLNAQRVYDAEKLAQLEAELQNLTDAGAGSKQTKPVQEAIKAQQLKLAELDAQIAQQRADIDAADAAITKAKADAGAAQALIARLTPETARVNDRYAAYTDVGGAETGTASWQTGTEKVVSELAGDIDSASQKTGSDAESALEATLAKLNGGLNTLGSADAYSEASLAKAIELSTELKDLADQLTTASTNYLDTANALYNTAKADYEQKLAAQSKAQLAYDNAHEAAELAQAQADADKAALDKELARSKPRADQVAALEAAYNASQALLDAARIAESSAQETLDAAASDAQAAKAVTEERRAGIERTEVVIAAAKDASLNAYNQGYQLSNTYVDVDARRFNVVIGQVNEGGAIDLYNEGDITAVVDSALQTPDYVSLADSDLTVDSVDSKRGDVTIVNRSGSILAGDNGDEENVHGQAITLEARDSIGSEDKSFTVEETSNTPTRVANPTLIDANDKTAFDNIAGIETATRFEDISEPTGSLYTDPTALVPVVLVDKDGKRVSANMTVSDLREAYALDGDLTVTFGVVDAATGTQAGSAAPVEVRLDWMRVYDETEGTELNATAHDGSIYLTERTGDIGAGEIRAAGDVVLHAKTGSVAEADDRTTVQVGGEMTVDAQGDVNLIAEGDLNLNLNTEANHVEIETSDKTGSGDITINSDSEKPLTGSALSNGSVTIENGGDIGTENTAFEVDTDAAHGGTANISGDDVNVNQKNGTMLVDEIDANGNLNLSVGGDIIDTGANGMSDAIDRVTEAQQALTNAERAENAADLEVYLLSSDEQVARAVQGVVDATNALENAKTEAAKAVTDVENANAALDQAKQNYAAAVAAGGKSSAAAVEALNQLQQAKQTASDAQTAAKQAKENVIKAEAALAEAENNPYIVLTKALEAIEDARTAGATDEKIAAMYDEAVANYRANTPNNGDHTDQVVLNQLLLDQAEAKLKVAQNAEAAAEAALQQAQATGNAKAIANAETALAKAQANTAQAQADVDTYSAALDKAVADTQAARDALKAATEKREHAAEALKIAEDALAAQSTANEARDAEDTVRADANDYLTTAQENLYDAYTTYAGLLEDPNADPAALAEAEGKVNTARQAVKEAQDAVALASGSTADKALAEELLNRLALAVDAEAQLTEHPDDANAQANASKAREALAAAKQAVEAAADRQQAQDDVDQAQAALDAAEAAKAEAEQRLTAAQQAFDEAQADTKLSDSKKQAAMLEALEAIQAAEADKTAAETAVTAAQQALADAQQALEQARQTEANALTLADAAAKAADAKTAQDEADLLLAEVMNGPDNADDLIDELGKADKNMLEAQKAYDEAYQDYLNSNTDIIAAREGAEDTDERRAALDKAGEALANARDEVNRIVDEIEAIAGDTGLADAEEAVRAAQEVADEADRNAREAAETNRLLQDALAKAEQDLTDAQQALADAEAAGNLTPDERLALTTAVEEAQERRDNAQTAAQNAQTAADKAAADKATADQNLADAQQALENAKQAAADKATQAIANTVDEARKAADEARKASGDAANNLNLAKGELGDIRTDATGTGAAPQPGDKPGTPAIRVTGNATLKAGGSVGGRNGSMTIDTDGTLKLTSGGSVDLQSGKTVNIDAINTRGDVSVTANGNINGVGGEPTITGRKVTLNAISTGNATSAIQSASGKPLTLNATELGARADEIDVKTQGDIKLNDFVAAIARIQVAGNVTQTQGTQLDVGMLDIRADGDIGSREAPIVINTDEITAIGNNVYIKNKSRHLLVHQIKGKEVWIDTDGSINTTPDGMIIARDLIIRALGNIGAKDQPIRLKVSGKLLLESYLGRIWYKNFFRRAVGGGDWKLLIDPETGISVYGRFADDAWLEVTNTNHYAQMMYPELTAGHVECDCEKLTDYSEDCADTSSEALAILADNSDNEASKQLWSLIDEDKALYDFVLGIFAPTQPICKSRMYFEIDFAKLDSTYEGALEGETLYVVASVNGKVVCVKSTVEDGKLKLALDQLGMDKADYGYTQFAIVDEAAFNGLVEDGSLKPDTLLDASGEPIEIDGETALAEGTVVA